MMTRHQSSSHTRVSRRAIVAAFMLLAAAVPLVAAGQAAAAASPSKDAQLFRSPDGKFSFEYPKKDWQLLPVGGSVVATLAAKGGEASVVIAHTALTQALDPSEITELFVKLEVEDLSAHQPEAKGATGSMISADRRVVVIRYARGNDTVIQYTVAAGADMYRVICTARTAVLPKYEALFLRMIGTFQTRVAAKAAVKEAPAATIPAAKEAPAAAIAPSKEAPAATTPAGKEAPVVAVPAGKEAPAATIPPGKEAPPAPVPAGKETPAATAPAGKATPAATAPAGKATPAATAPAGKDTPAATTPAGKEAPAVTVPAGKATPAAAAPADKDAPAAAVPAGNEGR
jgi:hypothetical protein